MSTTISSPAGFFWSDIVAPESASDLASVLTDLQTSGVAASAAASAASASAASAATAATAASGAASAAIASVNDAVTSAEATIGASVTSATTTLSAAAAAASSAAAAAASSAAGASSSATTAAASATTSGTSATAASASASAAAGSASSAAISLTNATTAATNAAASAAAAAAVSAASLPLAGGTISGNLGVSGATTFTGNTSFSGANTIANGHSLGWADASGTKVTIVVDGSNNLQWSGTDASGAARPIATMAQRSSTSPLTFVAPLTTTQQTNLNASPTWSGSGLSPAIASSQSHTGSTTFAGGGALNSLTLTDRVAAAPTHTLAGLSVAHNWGGAAVGSRHGILSALTLTDASGNTALGNSGTGVAGTFFAQAQANDGGTSGAPMGSVFGFNSVATLASGATFFRDCVSAELNFGLQAGSSAGRKVGLQIVQRSDDAVNALGPAPECVLLLGAQVGATVGVPYGLLIGDPLSQWPVSTSGSMLASSLGQNYTTNPSSAKWGVDFLHTTFPSTGNPYDGGYLRSANFSVDGAGTVQIGAAYTSSSASGLTIDLKGAVGTGTPTLVGTGTGWTDLTIATDPYGGVYKIRATAGAVTSLTVYRQPAYPSTTTPTNPVTLSPYGQLVGIASGLTVNIGWNTTASSLALNPTGGTVTAPTASPGDNSTKVATTAYATAAITAAKASPSFTGTINLANDASHNGIQIIPNTTGQPVVIQGAGVDATRSLRIQAAGVGAVSLGSTTNGPSLSVSDPGATVVNNVTVTGSTASGNPATLTAAGSTNAPIKIAGSGTGSTIIGASTNAVGFYASSGATKQTITGAKGSNAALGSLISALVALGLITDSTTA